MGILPAGDDQMHLGWQMLKQKGESLVNRFGLNHVVVVKDEGKIVQDVGDFIEQGRQNRLVGGCCWGRSTANTPAPIFAAIVCKAATRYVRKRMGSLSPSSRESQATWAGVRGCRGDIFLLCSSTPLLPC